MNKQQQAARDRAVAALEALLGDQVRVASLRARLENVVDDIILAAAPPKMTEHEAALESMRRGEDRTVEVNSHGEMRLKDGATPADPRD